jgi:hypothetical protein
VAKDFANLQKERVEAGEITWKRWELVDSTIRVNLSRYVGTTQINLVGQDKWKGYRLWRAEDIARRTRAQNCGAGQGGQRRHGASNSNITHRRKDPRSLLERVSDATIRTEM